MLARFLPPSSGAWPEWARGALEDAAVRAEDAQQGEAALTTLSLIAARAREQTSSPRTPRRSRLVPYVAVPSHGRKRPRETDSGASEDREASPEAPLPSSSIPGTLPSSPHVHKRPAPALPKKVTLTLPPAPTVKPKKPKKKKKAGGVSAADDDAPQILEGFEVSGSPAAVCAPLTLCVANRALRGVHSGREVVHPGPRPALHQLPHRAPQVLRALRRAVRGVVG